jgi:hypothetical protein
MKLKDEFDKIVHNVKDAVSEAGHREAAETEREKRELAGEAMTTREKTGSVLNEAKENTLAEVDAAKRAIRKDI